MPDVFVSPPPNSSSSLQKRKIKGIDHALSAYLFMPDGVRFETQETGEAIILFLRKHWVTNLSWMVISLVLIIIPIFLLPGVFFGGLVPTDTPSSFINFLILAWYLFISTYILLNFLLWYFTVSIVTNERVVDIDYVNILNKKFAATRISKIEDVTMRSGGFIKALFDYGDVIVQTAATETQFEFFAVPHPDQVVKVINQLMGKTEEGEQ